MDQKLKYRAFISYSHRDKKVANWLFSSLEQFPLPTDLEASREVEAKPHRLGRFFRDEDELSAAPNLGEVIEQALTQSAALIVVCSPDSAASPWVAREIEYFRKTLGRTEIFAAIVRGEPNATNADERCFPPKLAELGLDPLAADLRGASASERRDGLVRLVAGLCRADFDALRKRELTRARLAAVRNGALAIGAAILALAAVGASAFAYNANQRLTVSLASESRARLEAQRSLANERAARAAETLANQTASDFRASGASLFANLNESAIGYARTLLGWERPDQQQVSIVLLGQAEHAEDLTGPEFQYWRRCPRTLTDCFAQGARIQTASIKAVAQQGQPDGRIDAVARATFLGLCPQFRGPADNAVILACRNSSHWDVDSDSSMLTASIDTARGYAVFNIESGAYCGSGGCNYPLEFWIRGSDGTYSPADASDLMGSDQVALVFRGDALELITLNEGQAGVSAQYVTVDRYRLDAAAGRLRPVAHFYFHEDLGGVQPILTVCAEPFTGVLPEDNEC